MNIAARLKKVLRIGSHPGLYIPLVVLVVVIAALLALRSPITHRSDTGCEYSSVRQPEFKVTFGIGDVTLTASISLPCRLGASA